MAVMDKITSLLGGNIADGVAKIISLFKVDPTVAMEKQVEITEIQLKMAADAAAAVAAEIQAQVQVNLAEANNKSLFVAGWRPAVGWACAAAFTYTYVVQPLLEFVLTAAGHRVDLPGVDIGGMMPVLLGMLGLGAMRSYEKLQGKASGE